MSQFLVRDPWNGTGRQGEINVGRGWDGLELGWDSAYESLCMTHKL